MKNTMMRQGRKSDIPEIWEIFEAAIARRKLDGSDQWQDGYPNQAIIEQDIEQGHAWVIEEEDEILGYISILTNDEPEYAKIKGKWLTESDFVLFHRVAISKNHLGKGLAKKMLLFVEDFAIRHGIYSVKADTHFDNFPMLSIFDKMGYVFCGEVQFRGSPRKAFEKILNQVEAKR